MVVANADPCVNVALGSYLFASPWQSLMDKENRLYLKTARGM